MGKRSLVSTYRKTNRGARGVVSIKLREDELVVSALQISSDSELLLTTERGQLVRIPVSEIRLTGRAAKGVRIMNLNDGDRITGVAKLVEIEADKNNTTGTEETVTAAEATPESALADLPAEEEGHVEE